MIVSGRRIVQAGFIALTLIGVFVIRGHAERWCPFGGIESLYPYLAEGDMVCSLAASNFMALGAVVLMTILVRRAFCSHVCPVGAISEWMQRGAVAVGIRPWRPTQRVERMLAVFKYPVLLLIVYLTYRTGELVFRGYDPCYALISRHGDDITAITYVVALAVLLGSLVVTMPFCRWLCPLAAVLNPFARFAVGRVQREAQECKNCAKCSQVCPMNIAVDRVAEVTAARCTSCLDCLDACPTGKKGTLRWRAVVPVPRAWATAAIIGTSVLCTGMAVAASYFFPLPSFVRVRGDAAAETATMELSIRNLGCRGNASLLTYFVERDDEFAVRGYLRIAAWPGPGTASARITFEPSVTDELSIKRAITEPYYDTVEDVWRPSPFEIMGFDPLNLQDNR